jgi:hypothetical protein
MKKSLAIGHIVWLCAKEVYGHHTVKLLLKHLSHTGVN